MKVIFLFPCGCQWTQLFSFFVRWFGILALVCLSEFLLPAAAAAESFTAVGSGPTEQAAIQAAFRQAIRVQRGISLSADTYVINQQVARDQMHASMQGHIRSYRLLDSHFDGESYQVRLQVEIADGPDGETSDLTEHSSSAPSALKLGFILLENGRPGPFASGRRRLLPANGQDITSVTDMDDPAAAAILSVLLQNGFSHVQAISRLPEEKNLVRRPRKGRGSSETAAAATLFDYIIAGSLTVQNVTLPLSREVHLYSTRAMLQIRVVRCDTGESAFVSQYQESSVDDTSSLAEKEAVYRVGQKAGSDLAMKLRCLTLNQMESYTIHLRDIKKFAQLTNWMDYMNYVGGARNLLIKSYENGQAVLTLDFAGNNEELAGLCSQNMNALAAVTGMTANTIELTFQKAAD